MRVLELCIGGLIIIITILLSYPIFILLSIIFSNNIKDFKHFHNLTVNTYYKMWATLPEAFIKERL